MWHFLGILLIIGAAVVAIKLLFIGLILAGLIFKPKETLILLFVLGVLALMRNYPVASYTFIGVAIVIALARFAKKDSDDPPKLPDS